MPERDRPSSEPRVSVQLLVRQSTEPELYNALVGIADPRARAARLRALALIGTGRASLDLVGVPGAAPEVIALHSGAAPAPVPPPVAAVLPSAPLPVVQAGDEAAAGSTVTRRVLQRSRSLQGMEFGS